MKYPITNGENEIVNKVTLFLSKFQFAMMTPHNHLKDIVFANINDYSIN